MDNKEILMTFVNELATDEPTTVLLLEYNIDQPIVVVNGNDSVSAMNIGDLDVLWFNIDTDDGGYEMTYEEVMSMGEIGESVIKQLIDQFSSHSEIKLKDQQEVVTELTDDAIESVFNADSNYDDRGYIDSIFREGFKGYNNFSDIELEKEFNEIFDSEIMIYEDIE